MKTLAIIGGGASGLLSALGAAYYFQQHKVSAQIVVCEADDRVGRSILATGNGRCNFSNTHPDSRLYRGSAFVEKAFQSLRTQHAALVSQKNSIILSGEGYADPIHDYFAHEGLLWREEAEGRLYPLANKATSVLDVLRAALRRAGVEERCETKICALHEPQSKGKMWNLRCEDGRVIHADAVVLSQGARTLDYLALPDALCVKPTQPVLGPLRTDEALVRPLNNIRVRCSVSLRNRNGECRATEQGELLFRDYGVSGIAVFNLSRLAQPGDTLGVDFVPNYSEDELREFLSQRLAQLVLFEQVGARGFQQEDYAYSSQSSVQADWKCERVDKMARNAAFSGSVTVDDVLRGILLPAVTQAVAKAAGLRADKPIASPDQLGKLARVLKSFDLTVKGIGDARQCQVQRGGLQLDCFDASTMSARAYPGLFAAGEVLDIDAPCGGYNLHWAWSSGFLAGISAGKYLCDSSLLPGSKHA